MRKIISIKFMNHNPVVTAQICLNFISIYFISVYLKWHHFHLSFINQMFHPFSEVHEVIIITNCQFSKFPINPFEETHRDSHVVIYSLFLDVNKLKILHFRFIQRLKELIGKEQQGENLLVLSSFLRSPPSQSSLLNRLQTSCRHISIHPSIP